MFWISKLGGSCFSRWHAQGEQAGRRPRIPNEPYPFREGELHGAMIETLRLHIMYTVYAYIYICPLTCFFVVCIESLALFILLCEIQFLKQVSTQVAAGFVSRCSWAGGDINPKGSM